MIVHVFLGKQLLDAEPESFPSCGLRHMKAGNPWKKTKPLPGRNRAIDQIEPRDQAPISGFSWAPAFIMVLYLSILC